MIFSEPDPLCHAVFTHRYIGPLVASEPLLRARREERAPTTGDRAIVQLRSINMSRILGLAARLSYRELGDLRRRLRDFSAIREARNIPLTTWEDGNRFVFAKLISAAPQGSWKFQHAALK